ncbi:hypothetical protein [Metabacillus fastidiosus]|uniref:hypothetical protein n=2 Tax=Metabacillus fastidiosus TaxID=1458 RepID=UPI0008254D32|nr:hypothetical protein [Metabacillus fastidiosus]
MLWLYLRLYYQHVMLREAGTEKANEETTKQQTETVATTEEKKVDKEDTKKELTEDDKVKIEELSKPQTIDGLGKLTMKGFGYNNDLGIDGSQNDPKPYKLDGYEIYIENFTVGHVEPAEEMQALLNYTGDFQAVLVENNEDGTHSNVVYELSEMRLDINGETIYAEPALSDTMPSIEEGKEQTGNAWFIIKNEKPITAAVLVVPSEAGSSNPIEQPFKFDVLSVEDSVYKDIH